MCDTTANSCISMRVKCLMLDMPQLSERITECGQCSRQEIACPIKRAIRKKTFSSLAKIYSYEFWILNSVGEISLTQKERKAAAKLRLPS